jgi:hypothetical protein
MKYLSAGAWPSRSEVLARRPTSARLSTFILVANAFGLNLPLDDALASTDFVVALAATDFVVALAADEME